MNPAETNALLHALLTEVQGLRADLARQGLAAPQPRGANLQDLIDAIAFAVGDRLFTAGELASFAATVPPERLRDVLHAAGGTNPRKIGKLLHRMSKQEFVGWRVSRMAIERGGIVWKVEPASLRV